MSVKLRDEVYPPLPDFDGTNVNPAPDGKPWLKACPDCLFRTSNPQDAPSIYLDTFWEKSEGTNFYCIHRLDGEHNRVCACFAACRASSPEVTRQGEGSDNG